MHVMQNVIGAVDCTYILCTPVAARRDAYRNIHGYCSQNILAACSFDMLFIYILAGWKMSTHDTFVLNNALDNLRNPFPQPPPGLFFLQI